VGLFFFAPQIISLKSIVDFAGMPPGPLCSHAFAAELSVMQFVTQVEPSA
jgi:hypothetical protein